MEDHVDGRIVKGWERDRIVMDKGGKIRIPQREGGGANASAAMGKYQYPHGPHYGNSKIRFCFIVCESLEHYSYITNITLVVHGITPNHNPHPHTIHIRWWVLWLARDWNH